MVYYLNEIKNIIINYIYLIIFLFLGFWELPLLIRYPDMSLDSSWNVGMNLAFSNSFQFGKDVIFTYGLLGFLENPLYNDYTLWTMSVIFLVFVHFLFIFAIYFLLRSCSARWYHYLMFIPIFLLLLPIIRPHWGLLLASCIFLYLILTGKSKKPLIYAYLASTGLLLAIVSLLKFDMFINSIILITLFTILCFLLKREFLEPLTVIAAYICSLFVIWFATGQNFFNIPSYITGGLELTKGYTAAMAVSGQGWHLLILFTIIIFFALILVYSFFNKEWDIVIFLVLTSFIVFSAFKSVVVRQDYGHMIEAIWIFLLFLAIILVFFTTRSNNTYTKIFNAAISIAAIVLIIVLSIVIVSGAPWVIQSNSYTHAGTNLVVYKSLTDKTGFDEGVNKNKEQLALRYAVNPAIIQMVAGKSIDIIPWDISIAWANGLNWSPSPVFQSYSAYTSYLDNRNRNHISGDNPPEYILFSYKSIDRRYPLFDEPGTFSAILHNYTYVNQSGEFILITRITKPGPVQEVFLGSAVSYLGKPVIIPEYPGEIFGNISVTYSPMGAVLTTIYKPEPVYIRFILKNGVITERYRFIPDVAKNGLFLSQFVGDSDTLGWLFQGNLMNNIGSIIIETDHPEYYSGQYRVNFTGISHPMKYQNSLLVTHTITFDNVVHQEQHPSYSVKNIAGEERVALFEHSMNGGSLLRINNVTIGNSSVLRFAIALDPQIWSSEKGDGVEFRIYINSISPENMVFTKYIDPKINADEQKWNRFETDVSKYEGDNVTIFLSTFPGPKNNVAYDWSWWGDPEIIDR
jgi:hypothetical protein